MFDIWWLIGWGCGGTFVRDVVAHWFEIHMVNPCLICGGSLVGDVVAHLLEMWLIIGLRYGESVFDMWWLIGWRCGD